MKNYEERVIKKRKQNKKRRKNLFLKDKKINSKKK